MSRTVQIATGLTNVQLPDGLVGRTGGDRVTITDGEFATVPRRLFDRARSTSADGVVVANSPVVTSASAAFTAADKGRLISGTGIPAGTLVDNVDSATQVHMSQNATATGSSLVITISPTLIDLGELRSELGRKVKIASGKSNVVLPPQSSAGRSRATQPVVQAVGAAGDEVVLTQSQFDQIPANAISADIVAGSDDQLRYIEAPIDLAGVVDGTLLSFKPGLTGTIVSVDAIVSRAAEVGRKVTVTVDATSGNYTLTQSAHTATVAFNLAAGPLKTALVAAWTHLTAADLDVTGGPGNSGGTTPYVITFKGQYLDAEATVPAVTAGNGTLAGGAATATPTTAQANGATTLTPKIATTPLTGGVITVTETLDTPRGKQLSGTAISGANAIVAASVINIVASSTTAFDEGKIILVIRILETA